MKLNIEVEIGPNEVALATELLATLRSLTEHVKGSPPPAIVNLKEVLQGLIAKLDDPTSFDKTVKDIATVMESPSAGAPEKVIADFVEVFEHTVLSPELVHRGQTVVPFMSVLTVLPDPFKGKIKDALISKVLQHLTKKRPGVTDRTDFFAHAEAFAVLVKFEFVSIDGAAQTMEKLMNKPDTRSGAITMLGKTVELCSDKLMASCNPQHVASLRKALEKVTEEQFKYDVDWINQVMGWVETPYTPSFAAQPAVNTSLQSAITAPPPASSQHYKSLVPYTAYHGHTNTIFTMMYDPVSQQLITGGKDGSILIWKDGKPINRIDFPAHFVCSMDIHARTNSLLVCGVASEAAVGPTPPCIFLYNAQRKLQAQLPKPDRTLISCLKCFGQGVDGFVTGETGTLGEPLQEVICYYDMTRSDNFSKLEPPHTYWEQEALVTSLAVHPNNPHLFISGARDHVIRVWDKRVPTSVGVFGVRDPTGKIKSHEDMVTTLDAVDDILVSAGVDGQLCFWDLRHAASGPNNPVAPITRMQLDAQPILKVASADAPVPNCVAVSTFQGLYYVDYTNLAQPTYMIAPQFPDRPFKPYHDIKWACGQPVLFGASEAAQVDVYHAA